jgi:hypothetical protein
MYTGLYLEVYAKQKMARFMHEAENERLQASMNKAMRIKHPGLVKRSVDQLTLLLIEISNSIKCVLVYRKAECY